MRGRISRWYRFAAAEPAMRALPIHRAAQRVPQVQARGKILMGPRPVGSLPLTHPDALAQTQTSIRRAPARRKDDASAAAVLVEVITSSTMAT